MTFGPWYMWCVVEEIRSLYQIRQINESGRQGCEFRVQWNFSCKFLCHFCLHLGQRPACPNHDLHTQCLRVGPGPNCPNHYVTTFDIISQR